MSEQHDSIHSDHAHGNRPYLHTHIGEHGMGFGHTLAEHEQRGDLGAPAFESSRPPRCWDCMDTGRKPFGLHATTTCHCYIGQAESRIRELGVRS